MQTGATLLELQEIYNETSDSGNLTFDEYKISKNKLDVLKELYNRFTLDEEYEKFYRADADLLNSDE